MLRSNLYLAVPSLHSNICLSSARGLPSSGAALS